MSFVTPFLHFICGMLQNPYIRLYEKCQIILLQPHQYWVVQISGNNKLSKINETKVKLFSIFSLLIPRTTPELPLTAHF